jgi:hypothetical protein
LTIAPLLGRRVEEALDFGTDAAHDPRGYGAPSAADLRSTNKGQRHTCHRAADDADRLGYLGWLVGHQQKLPRLPTSPDGLTHDVEAAC